MGITEILSIVGSAIALIIATIFGTSQYHKRKTAEKQLDETLKVTAEQQKNTTEAIKKVAEEKRKYEETIAKQAPEKVSPPASSADRLERLRKPSEDTSGE